MRDLPAQVRVWSEGTSRPDQGLERGAHLEPTPT